MNKRQREQYEKILSELPKRGATPFSPKRGATTNSNARRQRSEAQKRRRAKARETVDGERVGGSGRRADPLIDWALRIVAKEHARGAPQLGDETRETRRRTIPTRASWWG